MKPGLCPQPRNRWNVTGAMVVGVLALAALVAPAALAVPLPAQAEWPGVRPPEQTGDVTSTVYLPAVFNIYPPVITYFDDFSDPASGWPNDASSICNPNTNEPITKAGKPDVVVQWTRGYVDGEYRFFIPPANATAVWFCQPDAFAPWIVASNVYTVETLIRYNEGAYQGWKLNPWWDNAGLIFGANEANTQLFMICRGTETYTDGTRDTRWNIHANTVYPYKYWDAPDMPYKFPYRGCSEDLIRVLPHWGQWGVNDDGYNHLMAVVNGDVVHVYVNGVDGGEYTLPGLAATTRVGLIGGPYEYTPSDIRADWFRLTVQYAP